MILIKIVILLLGTLVSFGYTKSKVTNVTKIKKLQTFTDKFSDMCLAMHKRINVLETKYLNDIHIILPKSKDCASLYDTGFHTSGVYSIWLTTGFRFLPIYCDMDTPSVHSNKRGWMVIQRRFNGQLDFNRNWQEYVNGFGSPYGEYWLGLENIYQLANYETKMVNGNFRKLRIELLDWMGFTAFAEHTGFALSNIAEFYRARLSSLSSIAYTTNLYETMVSIEYRSFSTYDKNNQAIKGAYHCAKERGGGWWFLSNCGEVNLNGPYPLENSFMSKSNIYWKKWNLINPSNAAFVNVSMKIQ